MALQTPGLRQLAAAAVGSSVLVLLCALTTAPAEVSSARTQVQVGTAFISPFAAPTDAGYLLLWEDGRHGPYDSIFGGYQARAYGTRLDPMGMTLDTAGLRVSAEPFDQSDPEVACIGGPCLIVWQQAARGTWSQLFDPVTGARGPPVIVSPPGGNSTASFQVPRVVATGGQYLVVWDDDLGLSARAVDPAGNPVSARQTLDAPGNHAALRVAATPTAAIAVWIGGGLVRCVVTDASGAPQTMPLTLGTGNPSLLPAAAGAGNTFVAVWADASNDLAFRRVSLTGTILDSSVMYPLGAMLQTQGQYAISDGTDFIVGYEDGQLHFARLSTALAVVTAPTSPPSAATSGGSINISQPAGNRALVTWGQPNGVFPDLIYSALVDIGSGSALALSGATQVNQQRSDVQVFPAAASLGPGFAVAYGSVAAGKWEPYVAAFDSRGAPLGAAVTLDAMASTMLGVSLNFDPTTKTTRAVWATNTAVETCSIDAQGHPSAKVTLSAGGPAFMPRMASLAGRTLVVWQERPAQFVLHSRYIESDGGLGPATQLFTDGNSFWPYDVAASATQLGLVWTNGGPMTTSFGLVTAGTPVQVTEPGLPNPNLPISIALASDQSGFLVVWNADRASPLGAVRLSAAGSLLDMQPLRVSAPEELTPGMDPSQPAAIFDGRSYVVAWSERVADGGGAEIYRRRVDTDGGLEAVEVVAGGPRAQMTPALAVGSPGRLMTVWLDSMDSTDDVMRAWESVTLDVPSGQPCTLPDECASGQCSASGLCCDVADGGCSSASDAGMDAGADGGIDAGADAGEDAGVHAGADAGADAGLGAPRILNAGCGCNSSGAVGLLALLAMCPRRRNRPDLCYRR